jgi:hypothetical protein
MFTDECVVYLGIRTQNIYMQATQNPHFFEVAAQHPPHVIMSPEVTSELIIGPLFLCVCDW